MWRARRSHLSFRKPAARVGASGDSDAPEDHLRLLTIALLVTLLFRGIEAGTGLRERGGVRGCSDGL
jgi:hypothetical protein